MKTTQSRFIFILSLCCIISCSKPRQIINKDQVYSYECVDLVSFSKPDTLSTSELKSDTFLLRTYSYRELLVVNAFGLYDELRNYELIKSKGNSDEEIEGLLIDFLRSSNRLTEGTTLALLEVQSMIDLIDCTILKLKKQRSIVSKANNKSQTKLSNWAIFVGAATTVITAAVLVSNDDELKNSFIFDWIAIPGGIAAGYLAVKSSKVDKKIRLNPGNNLVFSIWNNENRDEAFPQTIWYLLNVDYSNDDGVELSLRDFILEDWKTSSNMLGNEENLEYLDDLLKDEAIYNEEMIDLRIEMLEGLGAGLDQINRQLYLFNSKRY